MNNIKLHISESLQKKKGVEEEEKMVRVSKALLKDAGNGISKTLLEILVCPLSKQPLRYCEESNSLISDAFGVSYPIKDGIPCLVPRDGKILETDNDPKRDGEADSSPTDKD